MQRFHFLFLQHGDLRFLARHQRLFLREVEVRGYAVLELGFDDDEDALAVFDVFLRQRHALAQRQHVEIGGRHVRHRCQRHAFLGVSGRAQRFFRGTQIVPRKAPEIERVARIGANSERIVRYLRRYEATGAAGGGLLPRSRTLEVDGREQGGALNVGLGLRLEHVGGRHGDVQIVGLRLGDQAVHLRAAEAVPPFPGRPDADIRRDGARELGGDIAGLERLRDRRRTGRDAERQRQQRSTRQESFS